MGKPISQGWVARELFLKHTGRITQRGVARLSADLGMSVVVEGIETNEQLELISADGAVTEAQGYLFSRPVPAVRVRQLLNASHGRRAPDDQLIAVSSRSIA